MVFTKDSLETLKQRIDLVEVVSSHIDLKRSGATYKGLCPFHDEKSPSFVIHKGDSSYHCFGCGAHGDAIQFLINHVRMSFFDAVESLAERFHVHLERAEKDSAPQVNREGIKKALEDSCALFQWMLQYTEEGRIALAYLDERGIGLPFIQRFRLGWAPKNREILPRFLEEKGLDVKNMQEAGLIFLSENGPPRPLFFERVTFPILNPMGQVIGFSARKIREETYGGKYINSPETPLFKKSKTLYGLSYSRRRIAKEGQAIIVEGQIDALSLIDAGFDFTVAGQGTAFGEGHVDQLLKLGVKKVYLALDGDLAGVKATEKIGHLFLKEGVQVKVVALSEGEDPDALLKKEGPEKWNEKLSQAGEYLPFLFAHLSKEFDGDSPAGKNALVSKLSSQIRSWGHSVLVHESLRTLAHLANVPEEMVGVGQDVVTPLYIRPKGMLAFSTVDPEKVLECDFLRWLWLLGFKEPNYFSLGQKNIPVDAFRNLACRKMYEELLKAFAARNKIDLLTLAMHLEEGQEILTEIVEKKVNPDKASLHFKDTIQKILDRNWLEEREAVRRKIQSGSLSDDEAINLLKQFDQLKANPPKILELPST